MYNKSSLSPLGKCKIQVQDVTTKKKFKVPFTVVDDHHVKNNLPGCRAVQQMKLIRVVTTNHIHQVNNDHMGLTMAEIEEMYHDLFEGLRNLRPKLHLEVDPEVSPVQIPQRKIPETTPQRASKATCPTRSDQTGRLSNRLGQCNRRYPTIDDVLPELSNAKVFTKVDCSNGYWQVKLDDESSTLTTFNTPFGRFKWKRMPFRISPAGEIFQQRLEQAIDGLDGV